MDRGDSSVTSCANADATCGTMRISPRSDMGEQDTPVDERTIRVYETEAERWRDTRPARFSERAEAMGAALLPGAVRADLGCGAGKHLPFLGTPVVALDGAFAMVRLAREAEPGAWPIQADLSTSPCGGVHSRRPGPGPAISTSRFDLPRALADLHRVFQVGAAVDLTMRTERTKERSRTTSSRAVLRRVGADHARVWARGSRSRCASTTAGSGSR